ncbi:hypothetical protein IE077_000804 [Cardiosporidium cionae]|uniref:Uncharacterized protein n=1 Tax=Cardiosporidium cionae TaxID=476202 RepID=A0ABQ7J6H2_9APIC|nr:hypothetical protein IE077_000804 [Cardiosporidium cionae]|eukprot:KAF8819579.1 hypothetical protein IE077_000804 [Cardiosporidium cionae]
MPTFQSCESDCFRTLVFDEVKLWEDGSSAGAHKEESFVSTVLEGEKIDTCQESTEVSCEGISSPCEEKQYVDDNSSSPLIITETAALESAPVLVDEELNDSIPKVDVPYNAKDDDETATTLTNCTAASNEPTQHDSDFSGSSEGFSHEETMIIFDWDDTLIPSTWLSQYKMSPDGLYLLSQEDEAALVAMTEMTRKTLETASMWGTVIIVTNAESGWIELSCQKFLPDLLPYLRCFRMVSARSNYSTDCLSDPSSWKQRAFLSEIGMFYNSRPTCRRNVLSIGDSTHERSALLFSGVEMQAYDMKTKSIKFVERPCVQQLCREHEEIHKCLGELVQFDGVLDLFIHIFPYAQYIVDPSQNESDSPSSEDRVDEPSQQNIIEISMIDCSSYTDACVGNRSF